MAKRKKPASGDGLLTKVAVPIVLAMTIGGSSPWWWEKVFRRDRPPSSVPAASMTEISDAVQKLCGGKGSASQFTVKRAGKLETSKLVSLIVNGEKAGEAAFSKEEWDGIRDVQNHAANYTACIENLTPTFIDKFAISDNKLKQPDVKILDVSLGVGELREYCAKHIGVPPPRSLMNPPEQIACSNGTIDTKRPICLCP